MSQKTGVMTEEEIESVAEITEDETDDDQKTKSIRVAWQERLRRGFRHMVRMGPRGNVLPALGTHCIVMVGTKQDVGQMAQVTDHKAQMVGIKYRGSKNRRMDYKVKRPSSLIMLQAGLTMEQDAQGTVWICAEKC
jgi:hypothetical protein